MIAEVKKGDIALDSTCRSRAFDLPSFNVPTVCLNYLQKASTRIHTNSMQKAAKKLNHELFLRLQVPSHREHNCLIFQQKQACGKAALRHPHHLQAFGYKVSWASNLLRLLPALSPHAPQLPPGMRYLLANVSSPKDSCE